MTRMKGMAADKTKRRKRVRTSSSAAAGTGPGWLSKALLPWYREHHRPLPWRETKDPYRIWLSEVILQQTRVDQGLAYWERFVAKYPTVARLAAAPEGDVLKLWQGLGYYSRARNLLAAARQVVRDFGGRFPPSHAELLTLKGVGDYTASAIASICFGQPDAVVDGNVYRVLARVFGIDTPIDSTEGRKRFKALAQELVPPTHPGDHNQAVMELGATVCMPKNPRCPSCPLRSKCIAFATGRVQDLPVKAGTQKTRDRFFSYLHIATPKGLFMRQRTGKDIWQGLWELPLVESERPLTQKKLLAQLGADWRVVSRSEEVKHVLSHQVIHAVFWEVVPPKGYRPPKEWTATKETELKERAVPRLIERYLSASSSRS